MIKDFCDHPYAALCALNVSLKLSRRSVWYKSISLCLGWLLMTVSAKTVLGE